MLVERRFLIGPVEKSIHHQLLEEKDDTSCVHSMAWERTCYNWNSNCGSIFVALGTFNATFFLVCICSSSLCLFLEGLTVTF